MICLPEPDPEILARRDAIVAALRKLVAPGNVIPAADAIVVGLGTFNRILEIDYANRCVVAQSGVTNLGISHAVADHGFYYAPDRSSQNSARLECRRTRGRLFRARIVPHALRERSELSLL